MYNHNVKYMIYEYDDIFAQTLFFCCPTGNVSQVDSDKFSHQGASGNDLISKLAVNWRGESQQWMSKTDTGRWKTDVEKQFAEGLNSIPLMGSFISVVVHFIAYE